MLTKQQVIDLRDEIQIGKRKHLPAADRRMAALALADWYEERGRYPEAAVERRWAEALGKK